MVVETKFYDLLGVPPNSTDAQIKQGWRKHALKYHPDKNPSAEASDKFKELSKAYEVLTNPQKREIYDARGEKGLQEDGQQMDPREFMGHNIFEHFFGGGRSGPPKTQDTTHTLSVRLEDVYNSKTSKLALTRKVICGKCDGKGGKSGAVKTCPGCGGTGMTISVFHVSNMTQRSTKVCHTCQGRKNIIDKSLCCKNCMGEKLVDEKKILEVHIDKGMIDGHKIRLEGEGDQSLTGPAASVIIILSVKPHELFQRDGNDLYYTVKLPLITAICGGEFYITHLDQRILNVKIPAGQVITPQTIKSIPNEGMPTFKHPFVKGNLHLKFDIIFPPENSTSADKYKLLETIIPAPQKFVLPADAEVDEVSLSEYTVSSHHDKGEGSRSSHHGYHDSRYADDDDEPGPQGVQCGTQ